MFQTCSPRQGEVPPCAGTPAPPCDPPYSQCSPLPLFQPLPIPCPWLPGLHCSDGLATHTHSFPGRDGHPTTAIRVIFATCNSAQFFMKPLHGSSLSSGQRPKPSAWLLSPYQGPALLLPTPLPGHMTSLTGSKDPGSKPLPSVMPHLPFPWEGTPAWPTLLSNRLFIL